MLKQSYLYQFKKHTTAVIVFFSVYLAFTIVAVIEGIFDGSDSEAYISGWDFAVMIFTFVLGCTAFSEEFPMHLQNSVSRKTFFKGKILSTLSLCGIISLALTLFSFLINLIFKEFHIYTISLYEEIYLHESAQSFVQNFWLFALLFISSAFFLMMGVLISCFFYRANKAVKISVCIGVPVLLLIVMPVVDTVYFGDKIFSSIISFIDWACGITNGSPWLGVLSSFVCFAVFTALSWLAIRKTPLKIK